MLPCHAMPCRACWGGCSVSFGECSVKCVRRSYLLQYLWLGTSCTCVCRRQDIWLVGLAPLFPAWCIIPPGGSSTPGAPATSGLAVPASSGHKVARQGHTCGKRGHMGGRQGHMGGRQSHMGGRLPLQAEASPWPCSQCKTPRELKFGLPEPRLSAPEQWGYCCRCRAARGTGVVAQ